jgi:outer membrane lipoprotein-sorting protein
MNRRSLLAGSFALSAVAALGRQARAQVQALPLRDRELVYRAADYLQALKTAKGRFTQTSSRGPASTGTLYLSRPGKARFEYDPPAQLLVVSDGRNVSVYDRRLKTFDRYPLGATPLAIFLSRRIRLDDEVKVTRVARSAGGFAITVADAKGNADGRLVLDFADQPLALRGWTVVDGQGVETRVRLSGLAPAGALDPSLFVLENGGRS